MAGRNKPVAEVAIPYHEKMMRWWGNVYKSGYRMVQHFLPRRTRLQLLTLPALGDLS
jgi:hypothetical protein